MESGNERKKGGRAVQKKRINGDQTTTLCSHSWVSPNPSRWTVLCLTAGWLSRFTSLQITCWASGLSPERATTRPPASCRARRTCSAWWWTTPWSPPGKLLSWDAKQEACLAPAGNPPRFLGPDPPLKARFGPNEERGRSTGTAVAKPGQTRFNQPFPKWTRATFPRSTGLGKAPGIRIRRWPYVYVYRDQASHGLRVRRRCWTALLHRTRRRMVISPTQNRVTLNFVRPGESYACPNCMLGRSQ